MLRRFFITTALSLSLSVLLSPAQAEPQDTETRAPTPALPRYSVSKEKLQVALAQRFPLHYPVQGLLDLDLQSPQLQMLPQQNRLSAELTVQAAGPALQRSHTGKFALEFGLRYEPSDRTIRATQLRLQRLQFPTLQPGVVALLNAYAPALAERSMLEVVLHTLQAKDLALADVMGLQPGSITVTDAGLVIGFVAKPL
jgi:hypothetical protein